MPAPAPSGPGYWPNETTGVLRPAVEAYLAGGAMTVSQIAAMRAYVRQWVNAPGFAGAEVDRLRGEVDSIVDRPSLAAWLDRAIAAGIDPL